MPNYRVVEICNGNKIKVKYIKADNNLILTMPSGEIISGPPDNIINQIEKLMDVIVKYVPTECIGEARELEVSNRIVVQEKGCRSLLKDAIVQNIVEALASLSNSKDSFKSPTCNVKNGIDAIKKIIPDFRPEDAADLLEEFDKMATNEFNSDIAEWAIDKKKTELKGIRTNP